MIKIQKRLYKTKRVNKFHKKPKYNKNIKIHNKSYDIIYY